jgi:hypothetical protein
MTCGVPLRSGGAPHVMYDLSCDLVEDAVALAGCTLPQYVPGTADGPGATQDVDSPEVPEGTPVHCSLAVDASLLCCNEGAAGGDNRLAFAAALGRVLMALSGPALGNVQASVVVFAGDAAAVAPSMGTDQVTSELERVTNAIANLAPPPGVTVERAAPLGAMRAVAKCIELLVGTEDKVGVQRRVLLLTGGGVSGEEMQALRAEAGDGGEEWRTANCVIVGAIGDRVDNNAAMQLGSVAVACDSVEDFGGRRTIEVLKKLFCAQNPRRAHVRSTIVFARGSVEPQGASGMR